jgi:hypothetical protein
MLSKTLRTSLKPDTGWVYVSDEGLTPARAFNLGLVDDEVSPVFLNGWNNIDDSTVPLFSFYLSADGEVRFRGVLDNDAASDPEVCVLPTGFTPEYSERFFITVGVAMTSAIMQIDPDGTITVTEI